MNTKLNIHPMMLVALLVLSHLIARWPDSAQAEFDWNSQTEWGKPTEPEEQFSVVRTGRIELLNEAGEIRAVMQSRDAKTSISMLAPDGLELLHLECRDDGESRVILADPDSERRVELSCDSTGETRIDLGPTDYNGSLRISNSQESGSAMHAEASNGRLGLSLGLDEAGGGFFSLGPYDAPQLFVITTEQHASMNLIAGTGGPAVQLSAGGANANVAVNTSDGQLALLSAVKGGRPTQVLDEVSLQLFSKLGHCYLGTWEGETRLRLQQGVFQQTQAEFEARVGAECELELTDQSDTRIWSAP